MNHYVAARAARILIIINECGENSNLPPYVKVLRGTKLLQKYEFLLRYPECLGEIIEKENPDVDARSLLYSDIDRPNIKEDFRAWTLGMEKWKYGPFDSKCYETFCYLEAIDLIRIISSGSRRDFFLTPRGERVCLEELVRSSIHVEYIERAKLIKKYLGHLSASELTDLLYEYPQISEAQLGELIEWGEKHEY